MSIKTRAGYWPNLNLAGLVLILALNPYQFILEPSIADEKPECDRHERHVEDNVVGKPQGLDHLKACAFNRKGKSKNDINEHPTVWSSPDFRSRLILDHNHLPRSFRFLFRHDRRPHREHAQLFR